MTSPLDGINDNDIIIIHCYSGYYDIMHFRQENIQKNKSSSSHANNNIIHQ